MNKKNIQKNKKGFVLLYTMLLSSMILAIALGITNVALKEAKFSTSAKNTNEAFFAADLGAECALYGDRSDIDIFNTAFGQNLKCNGKNVNISQSNNKFSFTLNNLGSTQKGCAIVEVDKNSGTKIISKGYHNCATRSVERVLEVTY